MKIFQISFNRCGTTSLHRFLVANGMRSIHHDNGRLALQMDANLRQGRHILTGYEQYDAFSDMEFLLPPVHIEAYKFHQQILEQVPDAWFILNMRDVDRWVASRLRLVMDRDARINRAMRAGHWAHSVPKRRGTLWRRRAMYTEYCRQVYELDDMAQVAQRWKSEWNQHIAQVQRDIPADRLLVFDIEADSPIALCRFIGLEDSAAQHYRNANASLNALGRLLDLWTPDTVLRLTPRSVKRAARRALRRKS